MDKNILTASMIMSDYELCRIEINRIKERVNQELARLIAEEIIKNEAVTFEERLEQPGPGNGFSMGKRITARVVVLDEDEYRRLKRKAEAADKAKNILINF